MTLEELAMFDRWQSSSGGGAELAVHGLSIIVDDWIEAARKAFLLRWYEENGDDYENSPNVYGDAA